MAKLTPEQEALYALDKGLPRRDLPVAAQREYDRLKPGWEERKAAEAQAWEESMAAEARARTQAEARARVERALRPAPGHKVNQAGTVHTCSPGRGGQIFAMIFLTVCFVLIVALSPWGFAPAGASVGSIEAKIAVIGISAALFASFVIRFLRMGVKVSDGTVTIRNFWRTRTVHVGEIRKITVESVSAGPTGERRSVPRASLTDGSSIRMNGLQAGDLGEFEAILGLAERPGGQNA
jgi:PH (Pleckstrin Homology) domain-containing protein